MKKIVFLLVMMLCGTIAVAQNKGDMFISGTISSEFGTQTASYSEGGYSKSASQPLSSSFSFGVEYGCFVAENVRLALAVAIPFSTSPIEEVDDKWLKDKATSFMINPNVAYYVRLADKFYYTPEVGVAVNFGSLKEQLSASETYKTPFWGWDVYANLLALEFRVSERFAIGAVACGLSYGSGIYTNVDTEAKYTVNKLDFSLNNASLHFRFYL